VAGHRLIDNRDARAAGVGLKVSTGNEGVDNVSK